MDGGERYGRKKDGNTEVTEGGAQRSQREEHRGHRRKKEQR
jgi:hypothetical protein